MELQVPAKPGSLVNEEEESSESSSQNLKDSQLTTEADVEGENEAESNIATEAFKPKDSIQAELPYCILTCKSVFKCRLCPKIVCLSEDTVREHLQSKRHARSEKQLGEGRLKLMLNSDGEIEEDQETHAERHARIVALAQDSDAPKKKNKGRQRQKLRKKRKLHNGLDKGKSEPLLKSPTKKRRKNKD